MLFAQEARFSTRHALAKSDPKHDQAIKRVKPSDARQLGSVLGEVACTLTPVGKAVPKPLRPSSRVAAVCSARKIL